MIRQPGVAAGPCVMSRSCTSVLERASILGLFEVGAIRVVLVIAIAIKSLRHPLGAQQIIQFPEIASSILRLRLHEPSDIMALSQ